MFEDIFRPLDDITNDGVQPTDDWDTGEVWDSGEKENIWRTGPPVTPGQVWTTGQAPVNGGCSGGCGGCDDCDEEEEWDNEDFCDDCGEHIDDCECPDGPSHLAMSDAGNPWSEHNPEPLSEVEPEPLSEAEQLDAFDEMEDEEDNSPGTPTGVFDDIF